MSDVSCRELAGTGQRSRSGAGVMLGNSPDWLRSPSGAGVMLDLVVVAGSGAVPYLVASCLSMPRRPGRPTWWPAARARGWAPT